MTATWGTRLPGLLSTRVTCHTRHPRLWYVVAQRHMPWLRIVLDNPRAALRGVRFRDLAKIKEFGDARCELLV